VFTRVLSCTLIAVALTALTGISSAQSQSPQTSTTTAPKTDKEKCLDDKDHMVCKKYYRAGCIGKDSDACDSYAKELILDCPKPDGETDPVKFAQKNGAILACLRKVQCWSDRAVALKQIGEACKDPNGPQCAEAKAQFGFVTARQCDEGGGGTSF